MAAERVGHRESQESRGLCRARCQRIILRVPLHPFERYRGIFGRARHECVGPGAGLMTILALRRSHAGERKKESVESSEGIAAFGGWRMGGCASSPSGCDRFRSGRAKIGLRLPISERYPCSPRQPGTVCIPRVAGQRLWGSRPKTRRISGIPRSYRREDVVITLHSRDPCSRERQSPKNLHKKSMHPPGSNQTSLYRTRAVPVPQPCRQRQARTVWPRRIGRSQRGLWSASSLHSFPGMI